jgi:hypothetical protein
MKKRNTTNCYFNKKLKKSTTLLKKIGITSLKKNNIYKIVITLFNILILLLVYKIEITSIIHHHENMFIRNLY